MIDSLEIIAACGQEFSLYSKLTKGSCNQGQCHGLLSHFNQVLYVLYYTQI